MAERFTALIERPTVDAHVSVLRSSEPRSKAGQERLEQSALAAVEAGVTRWAVVSEGTKQLTTKAKVDVESVTVETFSLDEKDTAVRWARAD